MVQPLYVAFLWHMHQPYYRDAASGDFVLPWTRLHATKDYLHMADVLADFPDIHATFNFVPSLIEQLEDYAAGYSTDRALRVSLKDQLSAIDKEYLLSFFFSINLERVVSQHPAYRELLRQRQEAPGDWRRFPDQYWTDLIVWFNLAWFDPDYLQRDPELNALCDKGSGFSMADVQTVANKSRNIAGPTLAAYRRLAESGQVELCTSPYYHPILPLLMDTTSAREATPSIDLPPTRFAYPEDAIEQVRRGLLAYERSFSRLPAGLWPPEGAVSQVVADMLASQTDLRWIASDEAILARSLNSAITRDHHGHVTNPSLLYQPYSLSSRRKNGQLPLAIVFRDRVLADRIGFVYQHMDGRTAAEDLVQRLHQARENLHDDDQPHLLSIILDGENCWEYYENNGDDFLRHLYTLLSTDSTLRTVTVSEYLAHFPPKVTIDRLAAGSWIGGDMLTWIGEPPQNAAWDALARTRERLVSRAANNRATSLDVIGHAWQELYIAEGSDWFWWYSSRNNPNSDVFDALFRGHLQEVYRSLGLPSPEWLTRPILVQRAGIRGRAAIALISPALTAAVQAGPGWTNAGCMEPETSSATMQRTGTLLRRLYYGHDADSLYLRLELNSVDPSSVMTLYLATPRTRSNQQAPRLPAGADADCAAAGWSHELTLDFADSAASLRQADGFENWRSVSTTIAATFAGTVAEACVHLADLDIELGDTCGLALSLAQNGAVEERHPLAGCLNFRLLPRPQD